MDVGCAALRIAVVDGPLTSPPPAEGSEAEPSMACLSRKVQLQQCFWLVLDSLALCGEPWPRLAELAARVLFEQQSARPAMPVDPALEALLPF
jgi:hypothetical protein